MLRCVKRALLALALAGAVSAARAADLTLYYSFAEVREPVRVTAPVFEWSPGADAFYQLLPGTLELEHPGITGRTAFMPSDMILAAFEGKEVLVRRGDTQVRARVVNAQQLLFEANGQYFQADPLSVTYPSLEGVRFTPTFRWTLSGASGNATLSYLTRGLTWQPRYALTVTGSTPSLTGWADVANNTSGSFSAPKLTLMAGQANLASQPMMAEGRGGGGMPAPVASMAMDAKVVASGEAGGLQSFTYPSPVTIPPRSTTSVPFIQPKVTLERVLQYQAGFNTAPRTVVPLQRIYTLTPDADLPAGTVTVREDGRVLGQAVAEDTPKGEKADLNLGQDFDLRLTRTVQVLSQTRTDARFKVSFSLVNTKNRAVTVRLRELLAGYYGRSFELSSIVLPGYRADTNGFTATANLAPGARLEASYVVNFKLQ